MDGSIELEKRVVSDKLQIQDTLSCREFRVQRSSLGRPTAAKGRFRESSGVERSPRVEEAGPVSREGAGCVLGAGIPRFLAHFVPCKVPSRLLELSRRDIRSPRHPAIRSAIGRPPKQATPGQEDAARVIIDLHQIRSANRFRLTMGIQSSGRPVPSRGTSCQALVRPEETMASKLQLCWEFISLWHLRTQRCSFVQINKRTSEIPWT